MRPGAHCTFKRTHRGADPRSLPSEPQRAGLYQRRIRRRYRHHSWACVLLGKIAIGDWLTALVALGSLVVLFRWKVSNTLLVAATAIIGLIAFPLLKPESGFVK